MNNSQDTKNSQPEQSGFFSREAMKAHSDGHVAQPEQEPIGTVKELFTQSAWERLDLRGSTKVYTTPPQRKPLTWIASKDQLPPADERVFWMDERSKRVGYDTWMGPDFRWTASHWMPIPEIEAAHDIKE